MSALKNHWSAISSVWGKESDLEVREQKFNFSLSGWRAQPGTVGLHKALLLLPSLLLEQCSWRWPRIKAACSSSLAARIIIITALLGLPGCRWAPTVVLAAVPELHRHFPKPEPPHSPVCGSSRMSSVGTCWQVLLLTEPLNKELPQCLLWEPEGCWTMGVMESSSPGGQWTHSSVKFWSVAPQGRMLHTFSPWVCLSPKADPLSEEKPENLLLKQFLMCSLAHECLWASCSIQTILLSPISCKAAPCSTPLPSVRTQESGPWFPKHLNSQLRFSVCVLLSQNGPGTTQAIPHLPSMSFFPLTFPILVLEGIKWRDTISQ